MKNQKQIRHLLLLQHLRKKVHIPVNLDLIAGIGYKIGPIVQDENPARTPIELGIETLTILEDLRHYCWSQIFYQVGESLQGFLERGKRNQFLVIFYQLCFGACTELGFLAWRGFQGDIAYKS